jgi:transcriptional regulator with XRE-family HTH domain
MPNIDPEAKAWQEARSKAFGRAVADHRNALGLTASQLSDRTRTLGFPITRSTIARIEGNHRAGKVDLSEVTTLAAALDLSPIQLIFPDLVDGLVQLLPTRTMTSANAAAWFDGTGPPLPREVEPAVNDDEADAVNAAQYHSAVAVRHANRITHLRGLLSSMLRHPALNHPDSQIIVSTVNDLEDAKDDARHFGLVVEDRYDGDTDDA